MYTYNVELREVIKAIANSPDFATDRRYSKSIRVARRVVDEWGGYGCESFAIWTALRTLITAASCSQIWVPERVTDARFAEVLEYLRTNGVCDCETLAHGLAALRRYVTD
jgi:hypothetical protein